MKKKNDHDYKAITLMESTIYLGMFALLFVTMMQFFFTIGSANQRSSGTVNLQRFKIFLTQHLEDTIRNSDGFDETNSTTEQDISTLRFFYGAGYKEYYVSNGTLYITNGTNAYPVTSPSVNVSKFRADVIQDSGGKMYRMDLIFELQDRKVITVKTDHELFYIVP